MSTRLMRIGDVTAFTGLPRSTVYALMAKGAFPAQIKLSERSCAWRLDEIQCWIDARTRDSRAGAAVTA